MTENNRPVSYQQTLGTKTEKIRKEAKKRQQTNESDEKNRKKGETNL